MSRQQDPTFEVGHNYSLQRQVSGRSFSRWEGKRRGFLFSGVVRVQSLPFLLSGTATPAAAVDSAPTARFRAVSAGRGALS